MFELFPNVETLSTFLNGDLSKYKIQGLLKPCKNIKSIIYCFNDSAINDSKEEIDLYPINDEKYAKTHFDKNCQKQPHIQSAQKPSFCQISESKKAIV